MGGGLLTRDKLKHLVHLALITWLGGHNPSERRCRSLSILLSATAALATPAAAPSAPSTASPAPPTRRPALCHDL